MYHGTKNGAHLPCLSLWERWPSKARTERENRGAIPSQSPSVTALPEGEPRGCTTARKMARISLASPLGRGGRAKRGRRGETRCKALSVTFGDSSPKGRAKGVYHGTKNDAHLPCLSLWERWPSKERTERENRGAKPSQSPAATALPKGEPRGVYHGTKNGAHLPCLSLWERWTSKARTERGN